MTRFKSNQTPSLLYSRIQILRAECIDINVVVSISLILTQKEKIMQYFPSPNFHSVLITKTSHAFLFEKYKINLILETLFFDVMFQF